MHSNLAKGSLVILSLLLISAFVVRQEAVAGIAGAEIVSLSSAVTVRRGSMVSATASIKNTGSSAKAFYVGASIIGEGENEWKDLPGWGTTSTIDPGSTATFTFSDYTIPDDAYIGYHGIYVKVWSDSSMTTAVTERWFEKVLQVASGEAEIVDLTIEVIQY